MIKDMLWYAHDISWLYSKLVERLHPQCQIPEALNDLPEEICTEILEDANAHDLLRSIYPNRRRRRQDDWLTSPSNSPTNGWSDSDPSWIGKDNTPGPDAWSSDAWPGDQRTPKNPFKFPDASAAPGPAQQPFAPAEWPDARQERPQAAQAPGWSILWHLWHLLALIYTMNSLWTVYEQSMNSLWTVYEQSMNSLWTVYEQSMNSLWTVYEQSIFVESIQIYTDSPT